ncbi:MAG TPA: Lrp/AsnC family transcriptional regulator [Mycobacteriales bacterium]|nr:Lrp/AsnC family transcriptional regulator [Mycobacteriales bacterium]
MLVMVTIDPLDARLIALLAEQPRIGLVEAARTLSVARGTVQARLDKLQRSGVVTGFGPDIDVAALGYPVQAFVSVQLVQGRLAEAIAVLSAMPEVLDAFGMTGTDDLLVRVATRDTVHLQDLLGRILACEVVQRTSTHIALTEQITYRVGPLVQLAAGLRS